MPAETQELNKILVIRTDRIGDCILSTPVISALRAISPGAAIDVLTTPYTVPIFEGNPEVRDIIVDDPARNSIFSAEYRALVKRIAANGYDICFLLHVTGRDALTAFLAGVRRRVSPASKIYQLLSTDRVVQKRSLCQMNEAEYNLDLVRRTLGGTFNDPPARLFFDTDAARFAREYLEENFRRLRGSGYGEFRKGGGKLVLVHPGCGGSALNMGPDGYAALIEKLRGEGFEAFLSTGPAEEELKKRIFSKLSAPVLRFADDAPRSGAAFKNALAIIAECDAAVAPSTGIMHAAVALGKPVVALFCPIFVCSPARWGPYMPTASVVMTPQVVSSDEKNITNQKYCIKCIGKKCLHFNCMDGISVADILKNLRLVIEAKT